MKKVIMAVALIATLGMLATIPMLGHSATNCQNATPRPAPKAGAEVNQDNPDGPGKIWVDSTHQEAGVSGAHGWLFVDGAHTRVSGYESDGVNGKLDPNAAHAACLWVMDNKIEVP